MSANANFPSVDVIILNWNLPEDTLQCVSSVLQSDYPNYHVIVVDNGSTDDSCERFAAELPPGVELLALPTNLGFGGGNNAAIRASLADYTLLLNDDTIVAPDMISELIAVMRCDSAIGVAGPMIYYADAPESLWFAGMRFWKKLYILQRGLHLRGPLQRVEYVDFVSGCGLCARRTVWEQVGLFAPEFFMYYEDLDFSLRVKQAGFKLVTATQCRMWHRVSASTGGIESPMKQYYQVKSSLIFYRKHTRGLWFVANMTLRIGHALWVTLQQTVKGGVRPAVARKYVRGVYEALRHAHADTRP
ncbi:MAG: glycosyltransferase family 2 protein [Anaerolineae bacterium]|nr:glycosyltransferase family 2 protein [Anaerolineae bacterium]